MTAEPAKVLHTILAWLLFFWLIVMAVGLLFGPAIDVRQSQRMDRIQAALDSLRAGGM